MAISKKIGQDSEGVPIFKRDSENNVTDEIDHDLVEILRDFGDLQSGCLKSSTYRFSVSRQDLDEKLIINPQFHLPDLNLTIKQIEEVDGHEGWTTTTLGAIDSNVQIFKGPRLKTENLIVEDLGPEVEPYYTPSAVLQEKGDSAKLLDLSRANEKQIKALNAVRVRRGDIVVTRSGSIGRVAVITNRLNNAIVSDDLIRIRIKDQRKMAYVFAFLQSIAAQNQMSKNEYGAVQQHLEPNHVSDILIPVPEDWKKVSAEIDSSLKLISRKEKFEESISNLDIETKKLLESIGVG
jgi:preprotein translocase subunit YajC